MSNGIFESVLAASEDVTDVFFTLDPKHIINRTDHEFDIKVEELARELMFARFEHGAITDITISRAVKAWVDEGRVLAIDGTEAANFEGKGACDALAIAVATLAGSQGFEPTISITRAQARVVPDVLAGNLDQLIASLDRMHQEQSWTTTYREWCERIAGLDIKGFAARIFDGPLITQNLATQKIAMDLLCRTIDGEGSLNLGVIKDTRRAEPFTRLAAMALDEGEYIVVPLRMALRRRLDKSGTGPLKDVFEAFGNSVVRVIYRPSFRAFAIECRKDQWREAMAIVLTSAAKQRGMELPYQLLAVDARLRRLFPDSVENARRILAADLGGIRWIGEREER